MTDAVSGVDAVAGERESVCEAGSDSELVAEGVTAGIEVGVSELKALGLIEALKEGVAIGVGTTDTLLVVDRLGVADSVANSDMLWASLAEGIASLLASGVAAAAAAGPAGCTKDRLLPMIAATTMSVAITAAPKRHGRIPRHRAARRRARL